MAAERLVVVDYGAGNLRSAAKALEAAGAQTVTVSGDPDVVASADRIVLPGVGAFAQCIGALRGRSGLEAALRTAVFDRGVPFLGICVGMQLLATEGHEHGVHAGLGWLPGTVTRLTPADPNLKIPHMGWNTLNIRMPKCPLFHGLPPDSAFYFVHGYYAVPTDAGSTSAEADYPGPFCAALWRDNVFATQFHPEKSQAVGQLLLRNFAGL